MDKNYKDMLLKMLVEMYQESETKPADEPEPDPIVKAPEMYVATRLTQSVG